MNFLDHNFWVSPENFVPDHSLTDSEYRNLYEYCKTNNITHKVMIPTSGSTGKPKLAVLDKSSMIESARSVNNHLNISRDDIWLCCLPTHHVSGLSIYARAYERSSKVIQMNSKWDPNDFSQLLNKSHATRCSLVPAQLYDLVTSGIKPPKTLKSLIIGGDQLDTPLHIQSLNMEWPVLRSYGMTEACSQIATERIKDNGIEPLNAWSLKIAHDNQILIKGKALSDGYIELNNDIPMEKNITIDEDGFFHTGDFGELVNDKLIIFGRADEQIKILGEKVQLDKIYSKIKMKSDFDFTLVGTPDKRKGSKITMITNNYTAALNVVTDYNKNALSIESIAEIKEVDEIPRNEFGKINRRKLQLTLEKTKDA